eukprot:TRINITY_DN1763_c0_g1_i1.p1 TRINITY_DN1763_c0_g1~~TRINITY_DN1763_c0_g1_i1.p1  ORF type:complete len:880 (-),score=193.91 TRINITY_DN1763_c0_g1_i1:132-2666(-)
MNFIPDYLELCFIPDESHIFHVSNQTMVLSLTDDDEYRLRLNFHGNYKEFNTIWLNKDVNGTLNNEHFYRIKFHQSQVILFESSNFRFHFEKLYSYRFKLSYTIFLSNDFDRLDYVERNVTSLFLLSNTKLYSKILMNSAGGYSPNYGMILSKVFWRDLNGTVTFLSIPSIPSGKGLQLQHQNQNVNEEQQIQTQTETQSSIQTQNVGDSLSWLFGDIIIDDKPYKLEYLLLPDEFDLINVDPVLKTQLLDLDVLYVQEKNNVLFSLFNPSEVSNSRLVINNMYICYQDDEEEMSEDITKVLFNPLLRQGGCIALFHDEQNMKSFQIIFEETFTHLIKEKNVLQTVINSNFTMFIKVKIPKDLLKIIETTKLALIHIEYSIETKIEGKTNWQRYPKAFHLIKSINLYKYTNNFLAMFLTIVFLLLAGVFLLFALFYLKKRSDQLKSWKSHTYESRFRTFSHHSDRSVSLDNLLEENPKESPFKTRTNSSSFSYSKTTNDNKTFLNVETLPIHTLNLLKRMNRQLEDDSPEDLHFTFEEIQILYNLIMDATDNMLLPFILLVTPQLIKMDDAKNSNFSKTTNISKNIVKHIFLMLLNPTLYSLFNKENFSSAIINIYEKIKLPALLGQDFSFNEDDVKFLQAILFQYEHLHFLTSEEHEIKKKFFEKKYFLESHYLPCIIDIIVKSKLQQLSLNEIYNVDEDNILRVNLILDQIFLNDFKRVSFNGIKLLLDTLAIFKKIQPFSLSQISIIQILKKLSLLKSNQELVEALVLLPHSVKDVLMDMYGEFSDSSKLFLTIVNNNDLWKFRFEHFSVPVSPQIIKPPTQSQVDSDFFDSIDSPDCQSF